jgi:hypothetical protein
VIIPTDRRKGWGLDLRPRCTLCGKVAFKDQAAAERSAERIRTRDPRMNAYQGRECGNWHVGHRRTKRLRGHWEQGVVTVSPQGVK